MVKIIADFFVSSLALYLMGQLVSGVSIESFPSAMVTSLVLSVLNVFVKPVITLLTLPLTILTFGVFTVVINASVLLLASVFVPGFRIDGFLSAIIAALVLSVVSYVLNKLVGK